jgi:transposase
MDRIEKKRRWIVRRRLEGWKIDDIAEALQVSEKTVDRWWSLYRKQGWQGLAVKSKAPHTHWKTPQETVQLILELRRERRWGPCKIEAFHKAYDQEACMFKTHQEFIRYWNYQRPHQGIGYLYPADIYFRDLKKGTHVSG